MKWPSLSMNIDELLDPYRADHFSSISLLHNSQVSADAKCAGPDRASQSLYHPDCHCGCFCLHSGRLIAVGGLPHRTVVFWLAVGKLTGSMPANEPPIS
jgi:hypothetical protein